MLDRAAVLLAFEQVGGADRALEMAKDYALERYAFGRPIGSYQAIKHKLADIYVEERAGPLQRLLRRLGAGDRRARSCRWRPPRRGSRRREAYWYAAKENLQTHGGIGFTWQMDCHLFYRRCAAARRRAGAPAWKERLVDQLERRNAA